jgi:hypothetical protein
MHVALGRLEGIVGRMNVRIASWNQVGSGGRLMVRGCVYSATFEITGAFHSLSSLVPTLHYTFTLTLHPAHTSGATVK